MQFKLLEIESATISFSRQTELNFNSNGTGEKITALTVHVSELTTDQVQDMIKTAAMYPNTFTLINYNDLELSVRVDLQGLNIGEIISPRSLQLFFNYVTGIKEHLRYHQPGWKSEFGMAFDHPLIMGVINVTPDSFSDGGLYLQQEKAVDAALAMVEQGADIVDIGGESSRPGAEPVTGDVEKSRIVPVIKELRKRSNVLISADTYKADVAGAALKAGANWINDISGMRNDQQMLRLCREMKVPVVVMHMQGVPRTMQQDPRYDFVVEELVSFFQERIETLSKNGVDRIILDPGIGFGKKLEHNLEILRNLKIFKQFGYPLLVGTSRKSFIGMITGRPASDRLAGTLSSVIWTVQQGANIVRVHDVSENADSLKIINSIYDIVKQN